MVRKVSFEERYESCREVAYNKNQLFLGFCCPDEKVRNRTKCKLYCKSSGRYWETTSIEKHLSREGCPCGGCYHSDTLYKSQCKMVKKLLDIQDYYKVDFIGFKDDKYIGTTTKVVLRCRKHNVSWDTTEARYVVDKSFDKGSGCKHCRKELVLSFNDLNNEEIANDLINNYGFLEGTQFWKSDRVTSGNARNYWKYTCPKCSEDEFVKAGLCSGEFESFIGSLKKGGKSCRCSISYKYTPEQKKYNIERCIKEDDILFVSWCNGNAKRANLKCKRCLHKWNASYHNIIHNGNRCPSCAMDGKFWGLYKDRLDAPDNLYLFYMESVDEQFYKIGRSFNIDTRIRDLRPFYEVTLIGTWENTHETVFNREKELHRIVKPFSYQPLISFGGQTECFTTGILTHPEIISTFSLTDTH